MKKSTSIMLIVAPLIGAVLACGGGDSDSTRDGYQSREDCLKDWGDNELCEEMNDDDEREYKRTGGVFVGRPFYGPRYYPGDRAVVYKGKTIQPSGKTTSMKSYTVTSRSSSSSRSSSVSSPRGGFGGSRSSSSSGS